MANMQNSGSNREWSQAANKAKDTMGCAGEMASHAASALGSMASEAACGLGRQADDLAASAGAGLHHLGQRMRRNGPSAGMMGDASRLFAKSVRDSGDYL